MNLETFVTLSELEGALHRLQNQGGAENLLGKSVGDISGQLGQAFDADLIDLERVSEAASAFMVLLQGGTVNGKALVRLPGREQIRQTVLSWVSLEEEAEEDPKTLAYNITQDILQLITSTQ